MLKIIFAVSFLAIAGWFALSKFSEPAEAILARNGLHWHSELAISIFGQKEIISAGIGLAGGENPIHTHETNGTIHMEFAGLVKKDDLRLGNFFRIWGKTFNKDCIFDKCTDSSNQMKMLVNGEENFEFENYQMRDGDKIEILFEAK